MNRFTICVSLYFLFAVAACASSSTEQSQEPVAESPDDAEPSGLPSARAIAVVGDSEIDQDELLRVESVLIQEGWRCYELARRDAPDLSGDLKIRFVVEAAGQSRQVEFPENTIDSPEMNRCIAEQIEELYFRPHDDDDGISLEMTLTLGPEMESPFGGLDRTDIMRTIARRGESIWECYGDHLGEDPQLSGTVTARIAIEPDGTVGDAQIRHTELDKPDIEQCVIGEVTELTFPAHNNDDAVAINYPFAFTPHSRPGTSVLDRTEVLDTLAEGHANFENCLGERAEKDRELRGVVDVFFIVAPNGSVQNARISESSFDEPAVEACVVDELGALSFPRHNELGGRQVRFPLQLQAVE